MCLTRCAQLTMLRFSIWNFNTVFVTPVRNYAFSGLFPTCIYFSDECQSRFYFWVALSVIPVSKTKSPARLRSCEAPVICLLCAVQRLYVVCGLCVVVVCQARHENAFHFIKKVYFLAHEQISMRN